MDGWPDGGCVEWIEYEAKVWARGDKKGTNKAPIHQATRLFNQPVAAQIKLIATRAQPVPEGSVPYLF
jgi:hypothetical protein